ncbi:type II toxin-antitoxin system VapB family antitoxin [Paracoccus sp. 22332]|uniref:type II toxin-antitoxin system VapB family antitoxin n=1 Tax=Paracoccus sp. 22332 TaxID=3453913 RepID=UPI003F85FA17
MTDKSPIPDDSLDALAQTLADMLGVDTSEAMRRALRNEIERVRSTPTLDDQIETLRETVKNYGRKSTRMVHPSKKR